MQFRLYDIAARLRPFVKVICSMDSDNPFHCSSFRVLPDCCVELFVNYRKPGITTIAGKTISENSRSFIVSRMKHFMDVHAQGQVGCITVCFHPAGAYRFFTIPMVTIANGTFDLQYLDKNRLTQLEDSVATAANNQERVNIIQQYLIAVLEKNNKDDKAIDFCIACINNSKGQLAIETLSSKIGLSNRQLIRRFKQNVGLSPKEFARITKFNHALKELKKYPQWQLTSIAYESGYYDQAHFIHDIKEYSGMAPRQLLSSANVLL